MIDLVQTHLGQIWFVLIGVLLTGYAVLDGFDLGVGMVHLFSKGDGERRLMLNAIGPVWDGNEVWLVTGGGALFAAFPAVYATVFSGFYLALMLLLLALIFRAVSIEFRGKKQAGWWRQTWDVSFSVSSLLASLLLGVALGNVVGGIPLDARGEYAGTFWNLLKPYPVAVGITAMTLFAVHGSAYVALKTEGELQQRARGWVRRAWFFFAGAYVLLILATFIFAPKMTTPFRAHPALFLLPLLNLLAVAYIPRSSAGGRDGWAFISSGTVIISLLAMFGVGAYPHLVYSLPDPQYGLTLFNASSSAKTLKIMLVIAACGLPLVLAYTAGIYWIFRGKVRLDPSSY